VPKTVTIVAPVYNEQESVERFVLAVEEVTRALPYDVQLLLINDGSDMPTTAVLNALAQRDRVGVLHLSRNFGHQAALTAGLDHVDADACVCMDADLQHPPTLLPDMLALWEQGYEVVHTIRQQTHSESWFKRMASRLFYAAINRVSEHPIHPGGADFRLLDRKALAALTSLPERSRFLRGLSVWIGFRQVALHYQPAPRFAGKSKYTLSKMFALALDGATSTTTLPLRAVLGLGVAVSSVAMAYLIYVIGAWFLTNRAIVGWSSVIVSVLLLGGLQLIVLGMMGLYLAKVFDEVKGRPVYLVRDSRGIPPKHESHHGS